jgi:hypothetical protein
VSLADFYIGHIYIMKNSITISVNFYYKGKELTPTMVVDLDALIKSGSGFESLYPQLARSNNIDHYSYEYEVMLTEKLIFSNATGLASEYLEDGNFDYPSFVKALNDESITLLISKIAKKHLKIEDLSNDPKLKTALMDAFNAGQKNTE